MASLSGAACQLLTPNLLQQLCRPVITQTPICFEMSSSAFTARPGSALGAQTKSRRRATIFCARSRVKASSLRGMAVTRCVRFSTSAGIVVPVSAPSPKGISPGGSSAAITVGLTDSTEISSAPPTHTTASVAKIIPSIAFMLRSGTDTYSSTSVQSLPRLRVSSRISHRNSCIGKWLICAPTVASGMK